MSRHTLRCTGRSGLAGLIGYYVCMSRPKPCTIQIRTFHWRFPNEGEWKTARDPRTGKPMLFASRRAAYRGLADALYTGTDRLNSRSIGYEVRVLFNDGAHQPMREAAVDHAMTIAHAEQFNNSIGERLRRGETVAA